jgi:hypothetical protein
MPLLFFSIPLMIGKIPTGHWKKIQEKNNNDIGLYNSIFFDNLGLCKIIFYHIGLYNSIAIDDYGLYNSISMDDLGLCKNIFYQSYRT